MKTKQKKYNKVKSKKILRKIRNKVKNTYKKFKNRTKKIRKNANKGGMIKYLTGQQPERALRRTKNAKQLSLERLFFDAFSKLQGLKNFGYYMNFYDSTTNFDLELNFLNSVPINERLGEFINAVNPLPNYDDIPDIIESVRKILTIDNSQRVLGKENSNLEGIIRGGGRERNTIHIHYNDEIVYHPENPSDVNSYYRKLLSLLEKIRKTIPHITNLQLFYLISLIPTLDDPIVNFFSPFTSENGYKLSTGNPPVQPLLLFICNQAYEGSLDIPPPPQDKTESYFLKRIVEYRDIINASLCLDPPRTKSILDYILGENTIEIYSTPETLVATKSNVCFLFLRFEATIQSKTVYTYRLLGFILNIIETNIMTGEINLSYKFRWTLNTKDIEEINKKLRDEKVKVESDFQFLNDVYPLFSDSLKKFAYTCGFGSRFMRHRGNRTRPEQTSVLTTAGPTEEMAPIIRSQVDAASGWSNLMGDDGTSPRSSEALRSSEAVRSSEDAAGLIKEEEEKLEVP